MINIYEDTYFADILHDIAQALLIPTMIAILLLLAVTLFFLGRVIVERFTERRHFKQNMASIINDINNANYEDVADIVQRGQLLQYQKAGLITVANNMGLPEEMLFALAQVKIAETENRYKRRLAVTDTISKIGPLLGLMGTLIPLGPGIAALGSNALATATEALSNSLLLAFDATVCGLVCAVTSLIISKIRQGWYNEYIEAMDSLMTCILDKAAIARREGVQLPADYSGDPIAEWKEATKNKGRVRDAKASKDDRSAKAKPAKRTAPEPAPAPSPAETGEGE